MAAIFFPGVTRTSKKTVQFSREIKSPCRYHSSKNNKIRERVDSRVRYIWRLLVMGSCIVKAAEDPQGDSRVDPQTTLTML